MELGPNKTKAFPKRILKYGGSLKVYPCIEIIENENVE